MNLIFDELKSRYPKTVAAFSQMKDGERALRAVLDLERRWVALNSRAGPVEPFRHVQTAGDLPLCRPENSFDVVIAGGSLGLVLGAALAKRGLRVMLFDKGKVGEAHREWNISERELGALSRWGIFTPEEIGRTIATRYNRGVVSFDATGTGVEACPLTLTGVLDTALDAQAVLDLARRRFVQAGGAILERHTFRRLHTAQQGEVASVFELEGPEGTAFYRARLAIDTMGSVSPIAVGLNHGLPFDGVCPTAGTIVEGSAMDRSTGDVLVSVAPAADGRQLIWEGFPGRRGETTVYLFYYDKTGEEPAQRQSLMALFEQYFTLLPTYMQQLEGLRHIRPVYGYIPARHGHAGKTAARGLLCLGDSAAGQSPLTFCGFGSFVRHVGRVAGLISYALEHDLLEARHLRRITPHQANLRVAWVFSRLMQPWSRSDKVGVNRLMNVFCGALNTIGPGTTTRFLQDRYTFGEYLRIMLTTARQYPAVFPLTARVLGLRGLAKWGADILAFGLDDALRELYMLIGRPAWKRAEELAQSIVPGVSLALMSLRTGWDARR